MITLNISPDGDITISQETPGERIYMGEHYARMEREERGELKRSVSMDDDERAAMFKQGWDSAIRESQLQYVNGRIEEFWNEMGVNTGSEDPHHNEPEGTGEAPDWGSAQDAWDGLPVSEQPLIRPAVDSGEPEKETDKSAFRGLDGVWTISDEELQGRLDAEFERGMSYSSPTVPPRYSAEQIAELRADAYGRGVADAGNSQSEPKQVKFSALRSIVDGVAGSPNAQGEPATIDDVLYALAESFGIEIVR